MSEEQMSELREMGVHSSLEKPIILAELLEKLQLIEQNHTITTNVSYQKGTILHNLIEITNLEIMK